jgi:cyclohexanecarboxylate-CoA ligase
MTMLVTQDTLARRRVAAGPFWADETLLDHLARVVSATPDKTAVVANPGDVVSYQLPNWWEFVALHLACLRIGAITNPMMPILRRRELEFMLNHARSKVMVTPSVFRDFDYAAMIAGMRDVLPHLTHALAIGGAGETAFERLYATPVDRAEADRLFAARRPSPDDIIQVLYTSGTTGEPKGVMHTSNTLLIQSRPLPERLHLGRDTVFMASPMAHQTGFIYGLMMPFVLGAARRCCRTSGTRRVAARSLRRGAATFTMASTPFLADLTDEAERRPEAFRSLRIFLAAGAPIPRVLVRRATDNLGATIVSGLGHDRERRRHRHPARGPARRRPSRPTAPPCPAWRCGSSTPRQAAAGRRGGAPAGARLLQLRRLPQATRARRRSMPTAGSTPATSPASTRTATSASPGAPRTSSSAAARTSRSSRSRGCSTSTRPWQDVAIVGMPDERLGERACAFVVLREGQSLTFEQMTAYLAEQKMARQYIPERLEIVTDLPRTPSGKVQKFKLRETARGA